jgi:hypothetical protein
MRRLGAVVLVAGCSGLPCTDDIGHPRDTTFVHFEQMNAWADGTYQFEIALDGDAFECALVIPIDTNEGLCSDDIRIGEREFPDDPDILVTFEIDGHVPDKEIRVTAHHEDVVVIDETSTDFARDDNEDRDRGKVCAEWTFVSLTVPGPL